jgi:hypothetical protein
LYLFVEGQGTIQTTEITQRAANKGDEFGWRPFTENNLAVLVANTDCGLLKLEAEAYLNLLHEVPQLNYQTRKRLVEEQRPGIDWLLGEVETY